MSCLLRLVVIVDDFESFSGLADVLAAVTPPTIPFVVAFTPNWLLGCLAADGAVVAGVITDDLLAEVTATG